MAENDRKESEGELRVAIRYVTVNVPGLPIDRAKRISDDFAKSMLDRPFSWEGDFIHFPSDFDSTESKSVWFLCDFNVQTPVTQLERIPVQYWKVNYDQETPYVKRNSQLLAGCILT